MQKKSQKKLPNRFKLTPEIDKMIELVSNTLGNFQRRDKHGNLMFYEHTEYRGIIEKEGKRYKNIFREKRPRMINHLVELRDIWMKDGQRGVDIYVEFFRKEQATQLEAMKPKGDDAPQSPAPEGKVIKIEAH